MAEVNDPSHNLGNPLRGRLNLSLNTWMGLRSRYSDQRVSFGTSVQHCLAGSWFSLLDRIQGSLFQTSTPRTPPIFIIGHWRSGTTFLHELICANSQFSFPSTYTCMNAQTFAMTERAMLARYGHVKTRRPMDRMAISLASPQEDEFALLALGARSPYEALLFPKGFSRAMAAADPNDMPIDEREQWIAIFRRFIGQLQSRYPGHTLVLKSPTHSYRVPTLCRMYSGARFLHIIREPLAVFASTMNLWRKMFDLYALTPTPNDDELETQVLQNWLVMEQKLAVALPQLQSDCYVCVRYEDLLTDPFKQLSRIYETFSLGDLSYARPMIDRHLLAISEFKNNRFAIPRKQELRVRRSWANIFARYRYDNSISRA